MTRIIGLQDIKAAAGRIAGKVRHTPILRGDKLDALWGAEVYFKPENLQLTGSFKVRGATNKILSLTDEERAKGIIASSSGNHAQGVAYAAKMLGIKATLVLPENAPKSKIEGTKAFGAEVILHGFDSIQRYKKLYEIKAEKGYTLVHSYDDPDLIAGQGTSGLEIMEDLPDVDTVVVPLGGGGLLAGVAAAIKETRPSVRVIGVEPAGIQRYAESRKAGKHRQVRGRDRSRFRRVHLQGSHGNRLQEQAARGAFRFGGSGGSPRRELQGQARGKDLFLPFRRQHRSRQAGVIHSPRNGVK
ncbi:MAG: threonine dehydratase [Synergistaceae bacterium]|nr:threonine dehydratase [Synergistaceae bacterium]